jgi:hypothetical protein
MINNSLKAVLLSGLVLPGLGQVVLKHYKRGAALMGAFTATLTAILIIAVQQASTILEKIDLESGAIDINTISNAASQASTTSESHMLKLLSWLLIFCWAIGVVDAYRIGRKKDIQGSCVNKVPNDNIG